MVYSQMMVVRYSMKGFRRKILFSLFLFSCPLIEAQCKNGDFCPAQQST